MTPSAPSALDLRHCEAEPIRYPGAVQPHGALLVVDRATGLVVAASESTRRLLGLEAAALVARPLQAVLGIGDAAQLLDAQAVEQGGLHDMRLGDRPLVARTTLNERGLALLDVEDADPASPEAERAFQQGLRQLRRVGGAAAIAAGACAAAQQALGFDRVMVYRFDADWHGEVIGEARVDGIEPFLGLHYPASDIPAQARALYRLCRVRQIADVDDVPATLATTPELGALDLGPSSLRSVSPVHITYCRNMGVRATLVGSLVVGDRLWGLVACHHCTGPRRVGPHTRDAFAAFCDAVAGLIEVDQFRQERAFAQGLAARRQALVARVRSQDFRSLMRGPDGLQLLAAVGADGVALLGDGSPVLVGHTPDAPRVRALDALRQRKAPEAAVFCTHALERDLGPDAATEGIAGALFVSAPHKPEASMVWFRDERARHVRWGGNPDQPHTVDGEGRLTPRASFAQFLQVVRGQSLPWTAEALASAEELGSLLAIDALREREAFAESILDSSPSPLCVLDAEGIIVSVNAAWKRLALPHGASTDTADPVGLGYRHLCAAAHPQAQGGEAAQIWDGIADVLAGRRTQFTLDCPCDVLVERRWFQVTAFPMQPPLAGAVVVHTEITSRKRAELALAESQQRYKAVLDDQTDLICRFTKDGTILYANAAYCDFFGMPPERLIGNKWQPVAVQEDLPHIEAELARLSPDHPVVTIENRVRARGGDIRWGQFVNRAFFDERQHLREIQVVARDITDRKAAEARADALLREQTALLASPVVGIVKTRDWRVRWANPAFASMFGYSVDEIVGMPVRRFFETAAALAEFDAAMARELQSPSGVFHADVRQVRRDGSVGWFAVSAAVLDRAAHEHIAAIVDISARKAVMAELEWHRQNLEELVRIRTLALQQAKDAAEAAMGELQQAHARIVLAKSTLDAALRSMTDAVCIADTEGQLLELNEGFARFHRFADLASCRRTLAAYPEILAVASADGMALPLAQWALPRALRGEVGTNVEFRLRRRDTGQAWVGSYSFGPIRDAGGAIVGAVVVGRDITDSKAAQLDLQVSHAALQRLIAAQDQVQDEERARIARELHDDLQQTLAAIRIDLAELQLRLQTGAEAQHALVADLDGLALQAIVSVRRVIDDLRPKILEDKGLVEALRSLGEQFARYSGMACGIDADDGLGEALEGPPELAGCLLRVAQEGLNNVAKHSKASKVTLRLARVGAAQVALRIVDNGLGIRARDRRKAGSFGLEGMRERVRAHGGRLRVNRLREGGTVLEAWLPLSATGPVNRNALHRPAAGGAEDDRFADGDPPLLDLQSLGLDDATLPRLLHRAAREAVQAVIDALPCSAAVLDRKGTVDMVNAAWREAAGRNALLDARVSNPGADVLAVCRQAAREAPALGPIVDGLALVIEGRAPLYAGQHPHRSAAPTARDRIEAVRMANGNVLVLHGRAVADKRAPGRANA